MIFVTVGSQKFQFDRLLKAMDALVADGTIQEDVFAQRGACTYVPQYFESREFLDRDAFRSAIVHADVVITHGGTGAIISALKAGKKVIAVPRLAKFGEHVDDHQQQIISEFDQSGFIIKCEDLDELATKLREATERSFAIYHSNTERYLKRITDLIEEI